MSVGGKFCTKCETFKSSNDFFRDNSKGDGLATQCRICRRISHSDFRERRRPILKVTKKAWYFDNKDRVRARRRFRVYGLLDSEYSALYEKQHGCCAVCKNPAPKDTILQVDHCHTTGKVRGLLCRRCNRLFGCARDSVEILQTAIAYLKGVTVKVGHGATQA